jgi:methyl-accepting chemotaxis protein
MIKKMKLGMKLAMGFSLLLFITLGLGGLAVWNMIKVEKTAQSLALEKVPEVRVANSLERSAFNTMLEIRGYTFTEEEEYLKRGTEFFTQVKKHLEEAKSHGGKFQDLKALTEAVAKAEAAALNYEKLVNQTVSLTQGLESERKSAEVAAAAYMKFCAEYLDYLNKTMAEEILTGKEAVALYERLRKIALTGDLINLGNQIVTGTWKSQLRRDPALFAETKKLFEPVYQKINETISITHQEMNRNKLNGCLEAAKAYEANMAKFLSLWLEREEVSKKRNEAANQVLAEASATAELGMDDTEKGALQSASALGQTSSILTYGLIAALASGLLLAFFLTRSITRPIIRIIAGLTDGSREVSAAASQVSSAAQSLAEGSSEQAASIEESSSSLEEMSSMIKRNADNAHQANIMMESTQSVVNEADGSMQQLTQSMGEISQASEKTSKIIKTIDEIAFQTNLLALNAAVEAARAGEAGAGFAVVADEVRSLAMRAAEAAKNTADLIEGTVKKVKDGTSLLARTNEAFTKVSDSAGKVADLVSEIAAASTEQAKGISQINTAVTELDKLTQQNAANAEESASAAEEMNAQAETMLGIVGELVAMVGGGNNGKREKSLGRRSVETPSRVQLPIHSEGKVLKAALPSPVRRTSTKDYEMDPEAVIPLDEKDFADF